MDGGLGNIPAMIAPHYHRVFDSLKQRMRFQHGKVKHIRLHASVIVQMISHNHPYSLLNKYSADSKADSIQVCVGFTDSPVKYTFGKG